MLRGEGQVIARVQEYIDCRGQSATAAMPQHHDQLQTAAEILHRVFETPEHLRAQTVTCHADHKKIVRSFVEYQFDGYAGIGTAEYGSKRSLLRHLGAVRSKAQIVRVDRDDLLYPALVQYVIDKRSEGLVAVFQSEQSCVAVRRQRPDRGFMRVIPINDVDRPHAGLLLRRPAPSWIFSVIPEKAEMRCR